MTLAFTNFVKIKEDWNVNKINNVPMPSTV